MFKIKKYLNFTHVFNNTDNFNARTLTESDLLSYVSQGDFLRRCDQDSSVNTNVLQEINNGNVFVRSTRRSYRITPC